MSNVSKNLSLVKEKIRAACLKRAPELQGCEPRLVAVSKTKPLEAIFEAYEAGQRHFGENYVDELAEKGSNEQLQKLCPDIKWHFIGHLQRNKVNKLLAVPNLYIVESVDSEKLADALNSRFENFPNKFGQQLNVFIQVNTSGEEAKSGCRPEHAPGLVKHTIENCKNLKFLGLMTIGKYDNYNSEGINEDFQVLKNCRKNVCEELKFDVNCLELSMGMSGDFEHASWFIDIWRKTNESSKMKINRYRKVHKILKFYSNNYGFRKPYQVLIDGTICVAALKNQINIQEQFPKYLDNGAKLLTTQCIVKEMEKLGPATFGALLIIKKFGVHRCGHEKSAVPAIDCILDMIGEKNASRYIIASQDRELQNKCRRMEGVPLLYLHSRTPVLEPPSSFTQGAANEKTMSNFSVNSFEKKKLILLKKEENSEEETETRKKRKRKGGPNPLSCKKKKKKTGTEEGRGGKPKNKDETKKKRKRNRSRLVKKIKNEIMASVNPPS